MLMTHIALLYTHYKLSASISNPLPLLLEGMDDPTRAVASLSALDRLAAVPDAADKFTGETLERIKHCYQCHWTHGRQVSGGQLEKSERSVVAEEPERCGKSSARCNLS